MTRVGGGAPPEQDLSGKIALVTGAARNVGKAIVTNLAARGAHVLINYFHSHEQAKRTQEELRTRGAEADLLRASVARPEQVDMMFADIERRFGRLDVLVNNAANGALVPVSEVSDADLDRALDTNLKGGLRCARAAAPLMARGGGGSIITVSALGGSQMVMANYFACAPAKAAAEAMTRYLAVEFAPMNIRVNTASAAMLTSEVADAFPDAAAMQAAVIAGTPLGRLGTPEEFAEVVAFLASDRSSWITGQVLLADGGLTLGASLMSPVPLPPAGEEPPRTAAAVPRVPAAPARCADAPPTAPSGRTRDGSAPETAAPDAPEDTTHAPPAAPDDPEHTEAPKDTEEIAVVGMGLAVSGANSPEEFWALRTTGGELFVEVPEDRWERATFASADPAAEDKSYQDTCVFITDFAPEPAALEDLPGPPGQTELTTLWLRHCLVQALEGVRVAGTDRFSFHVGYTADGSQHLEEAGVLAAANHLAAEALAGADVSLERRTWLLERVNRVLSGRYHRGGAERPDFLPHQVGRRAMAGILPEDTQVHMVDTACSSSLYAIDIGVKGLLMGKQDIAVCGGAFALAPRGTVLFSKLKGLSRRGAVHALDAAADGVIFADGAGVVVLKRLGRARADGDRILGVLRAFGSSSDGKGKAVYAPNSTGQDLAVRRALTAGGFTGVDIDWVNAHATGTPAGDLAEFTTLREYYGVARATSVTSNKSLIGHTGWAAGVVSLIETILAMREETIPGQYRFRSAPAAFGMDGTNLEISSDARPWRPVPGRRRTAAISGFGFGGTNAHLIVSEPEDALAPVKDATTRGARAVPPAADPADRVAVVALAAKLPGVEKRDEILGRLFGEASTAAGGGIGTGIAPGFGDQYPAPPFQQVRMPPATVRTIDRCQLMILACAHDLRDQLPEFWQAHAERTGVVIGNMGPTRSAMLYANRCYLDDIEKGLRSDRELAAAPELPGLVDRLRQRVRSASPPSNEDSFPGMMPNVISARVANYFDLNGPNITVDAGLASTLSAFATATRYLHSGELDFVLAGGINGNSLPEYRALLGEVFGDRAPDLREGAFLFGLTTEHLAREAGLDILGYVDEPVGEDARTDEILDCGPRSEYSGYLGAAGGVEILRALRRPAGAARVRCQQPGADTAVELLVTAATGPADEGRATTAPPTGRDGEQAVASAQDRVRRYTATLRPAPTGTVAPTELPAVPAGSVVLTDAPELVMAVAARDTGMTVLSTVSLREPRPGWHHLAEVTPQAVRRALDGAAHRPSHLRVIADLSASAPPAAALTDDCASLSALHDLVFLVVKQCGQSLAARGSSTVFTLLGAMPDGVPHPLAGLFSGLAKCVSLELPDADCYALFAATRDAVHAARLAREESGYRRSLPVVYHDGVRRLTPTVTPEPVATRSAGTRAPLDRDSVVVALGGARGITAELLTAVAERYGCRIFVLGSNALEDYPPETFAGTDAEFAAGRAAYISAGLSAESGTVARLTRRFDRMVDARAARRNLARMTRHSGAGRVTYLTCDARDATSVRTAVDQVLAEENRIDLVINAPGLNRSALIQDKDFAEFRAIRDLKVAAHRNLHRALASRAPRMWCDFGSLLGFFGQRGESDYASGNDFLATAAGYAAATSDTDEFVIGWTLWDEVGMGANELTHDYFQRAGAYSLMPVAEGIRHFLAELAAPGHSALTVHMGAAERATVARFYPAFPVPDPAATAVRADPAPAPGGRFYLRRVLDGRNGSHRDEVRFECPFSLETDGYLRHHLVRGVPTLPGTFVAELAAEAALHLVPGGEVLALEDVRFLRFLQVRPGVRPDPKRITARIIERAGGLVTVSVEITHDVLAPSGVLLVRDKPHFRARVVVGTGFPAAPIWQPWDAAGERPVIDPYHERSAPVLLTGPFECTTSTRRHPQGSRSVFRPRLDPHAAPWASFLTPTLLLDAMARTGVLDPADGLVPVAAPLSIRRIDLYQRANDVQLAAEYGALDLYVDNPGFSGSHETENHFVAVAPDGRVLASMTGLDAKVIGRLDPADGLVHEPGAVPAAVGAGSRVAGRRGVPA
ncbi:SDR family oxidoreductase [Streptomyces sp. RKCA744]|uniref:SDR family oxidoreductase n=1 Tax=Streptomyces sp. RKCA744 TaxID=2959340 RepID=UPI00209D5F49|nr:SDR family oxidoreductase [Streptomyces sp. RKCA744]MCO8308815.1 SDR family oxidoreductase [Streptomyces sp. RKCA744]